MFNFGFIHLTKILIYNMILIWKNDENLAIRTAVSWGLHWSIARKRCCPVVSSRRFCRLRLMLPMFFVFGYYRFVNGHHDVQISLWYQRSKFNQELSWVVIRLKRSPPSPLPDLFLFFICDLIRILLLKWNLPFELWQKHDLPCIPPNLLISFASSLPLFQLVAPYPEGVSHPHP